MGPTAYVAAVAALALVALLCRDLATAPPAPIVGGGGNGTWSWLREATVDVHVAPLTAFHNATDLGALVQPPNDDASVDNATSDRSAPATPSRGRARGTPGRAAPPPQAGPWPHANPPLAACVSSGANPSQRWTQAAGAPVAGRKKAVRVAPAPVDPAGWAGPMTGCQLERCFAAATAPATRDGDDDAAAAAAARSFHLMGYGDSLVRELVLSVPRRWPSVGGGDAAAGAEASPPANATAGGGLTALLRHWSFGQRDKWAPQLWLLPGAATTSAGPAAATSEGAGRPVVAASFHMVRRLSPAALTDPALLRHLRHTGDAWAAIADAAAANFASPPTPPSQHTVNLVNTTSIADFFEAAGAWPQLLLLSRGAWDRQNTDVRPDATHADVRATLRTLRRRWRRHRWRSDSEPSRADATEGSTNAKTTFPPPPRVVLYAVHCAPVAHRPTYPSLHRCVAPLRSRAYVAALACAVADAILDDAADEATGGGGNTQELRLDWMDGCGYVSALPPGGLTEDGLHLADGAVTHRMADAVLRHFVCPAASPAPHRSDDGRASDGRTTARGRNATGGSGGTALRSAEECVFTTATLSQAEVATALATRYECGRMFPRDTQPDAAAQPGATPAAVTEASDGGGAPAPSRTADGSFLVATPEARRKSRRLGWEPHRACNCWGESETDECKLLMSVVWPPIFSPDGFVAGFSLSSGINFVAPYLCMLQAANASGKVFDLPPTTLPPARWQRARWAHAEMLAAMCLRPARAPLCLLNAGVGDNGSYPSAAVPAAKLSAAVLAEAAEARAIELALYGTAREIAVSLAKFNDSSHGRLAPGVAAISDTAAAVLCRCPSGAGAPPSPPGDDDAETARARAAACDVARVEAEALAADYEAFAVASSTRHRRAGAGAAATLTQCTPRLLKFFEFACAQPFRDWRRGKPTAQVRSALRSLGASSRNVPTLPYAELWKRFKRMVGRG